MLFNFELASNDFSTWVFLASGFFLSFIITVYGIPSVNRLARAKNLYDNPGTRTSHSIPTPRLGGSIIFSGVILSSVLFTGLSTAYELKYIIAGMIILFFIGIKDDLVSLVPYKKAIGQLLASAIIVIPGDIHLNICTGLTGMEIPDFIFNVLISVFLIMSLINSINFIDGIDGLASGVGILVSLSFSIWFIFEQKISYAVICFALIGSLIAFFYFNVFSKKNKSFMGDTGSMLIGFLLAVFVIQFLNENSYRISLDGSVNSAFAIALSILFVPVFDTIRICLIRIYNHKSIFIGDSNHVHHRILKFTDSHFKATLIILAVNLIVILLTVFFRKIEEPYLLMTLLLFGVIFSIILGVKENEIKPV
jgi:UDP-GlcNAc:undecaprenyl-phosphate/decaprenyl-phosphate GlcNAc-1-phosphate transferase